jgi:triacylglycerol lipase
MNLRINPTSIVQDPGERPLVLHSQVSGPVGEMSILKRSLLMAELSMIAYNDHDEARRACQAIGFHDVTFFDRDGSQAYRVRNEHDCIVACRGTEPHEWNDIQADANAFSVVAETVGRVHRGFRREVDDLWPMLETALAESELPTWFCGHSLGGAMATICAYRCFVSPIRCNPTGLYTFGSPRVGDRRYVRFVKVKHYRFVNNNDIVTRVPPAWMGYRHEGIEMYIDHRGRIRELSREGKRLDRIRGFLQALRRFRLDHFDDHSIHHYITAIAAAVAQENEAQENRMRHSKIRPMGWSPKIG